MLLAQIHTDLFQPGEAVAVARAGAQRMPYLRSLNQLANDQKGSANLGAALAFFGMEDWALELAQQSFYPYRGGSHLFLADCYAGEFNKNSALYQGFHRPHGLWRQPALRLAVAAPRQPRRRGADARPRVLPSGIARPHAQRHDNRHVPVSWFVKAQTARALRFPVDGGGQLSGF
jgi:hypothetical protein